MQIDECERAGRIIEFRVGFYSKILHTFKGRHKRANLLKVAAYVSLRLAVLRS